MILTPTTDLSPFAGQRVVINHVRTAKVGVIRHGATARSEHLHGGVFGDWVEDPHAGCRGGSAAFWLEYGSDLEVFR
jgi:hypothetical protein